MHQLLNMHGALPLPAGERVGVRGFDCIGSSPSPDRFAVDLSPQRERYSQCRLFMCLLNLAFDN